MYALEVEAIEDELSSLVEELNNENCKEDVPGVLKALARLKEMEPVESEPIHHARWIPLSRGDECSRCGYQTGRYESGGRRCNGCGALMDEEL